MSKQFKIGCIGTGNISTHAHIPAYVSHSKIFKIVAMFDNEPKNAEKAKELYVRLMQEAGQPVDWEIAICNTAEQLMQKVDMVDICTPLRWHSHYAAMALRHNVHAMSEKPMARTWWEAREVADAAQTSKAQYQLNDDNLFIPRYQFIRNIIESGMIGEVQNVWIARGTSSSARAKWFFDPIVGGGGCILDYGTHAVTSTWFMIGFDKIPEQVRSLGIRVKDRTRFIEGRLQEIEVDDDAHFKIRYVNPANGDWINVVIEATWSWPELGKDGSDVRGYIEVQGSKGTVTAIIDENDQEYLKITDRFFGERLIPIKSYLSEDLSFYDEMANMYNSIESGNQSILHADRGVDIVKIINCAQLSELRNRGNISFAELEQFTAAFTDRESDPLLVGDKMCIQLNEPHKKKL